MPRKKRQPKSGKKWPTPREWQVIWRVAWGYTYKEIQEALGLGVWRTAERHCYHASKKIGDGKGSKKAQVTRWFLRNFPNSHDPWELDRVAKEKRQRESASTSYEDKT